MTLDPDLLIAFVTVSSQRSFTKAAHSLNRTQSTVSHQIRRLERILGTQLMERDARSIRLTRNGEAVLEMARKILNLNLQLTSFLSRAKTATRWRIGVTEGIPVKFIAVVLELAADRAPGVDLSFEMGTSEALRTSINSGELDLALVAIAGDKADVPVLARRQLVWVGALGWRPAAGGSVPLVSCGPPCTNRTAAVDNLRQHGIAWSEVVIVGNSGTVLDAVRSGLGVGVVTAEEVDPGVRCLTVEDGFPQLPQVSIGLIHQPAKQDDEGIFGLIEASWQLFQRREHRSPRERPGLNGDSGLLQS